MESREGQAIRLGSLDTLRGVAILAVLTTHTTLDFAGRLYHGAAFQAAVNQGVQLFFLVSSYTMCTMWRARAGESHRAVNFYIRRLCRIGPLYWLAILGYGLVRGWQPFPDVLANVLFVHSVVPTAINSVVPGGWSIGVEIAFYLLFPLIARVPGRWLLPLAGAWYLVAGIGVEHLLLGAGVDQSFLFYSPLTQMPIFLIGMYVFDWVHGVAVVPRLTVALTGLAWIGSGLVFRHLGWPGRPAFWIAIVAMSALLGLMVRHGIAFRPLQWVGQISYSMYLIHFAVLGLLLRILPPATDAMIALPIVIMGTAALAWVSFLTGERWSTACQAAGDPGPRLRLTPRLGSAAEVR